MKNQLIDLIKKINTILSDEQLDKLISYVEMLAKWNNAYNLTAIRDPNEMLVKHIMDSLVVSPYLQGSTFIDVGTGPGLPGVPLAIINPNKQFDLVDSLGKRVRFLKQVKLELKLNNINPVQSRIEEYTVKQFDGVISRAFASLSDMVNWCHHLPNDKGVFYALKGIINKEEFDTLADKFIIKQIIKLKVPNLDAERHLIIIK